MVLLRREVVGLDRVKGRLDREAVGLDRVKGRLTREAVRLGRVKGRLDRVRDVLCGIGSVSSVRQRC